MKKLIHSIIIAATFCLNQLTAMELQVPPQAQNFISEAIDALIKNPAFMTQPIGNPFDQSKEIITVAINNEKESYSSSQSDFLVYIESKLQEALQSNQEITPNQKQRIHIFFDVILEEKAMNQLILTAHQLNDAGNNDAAVQLVVEKMKNWKENLYPSPGNSISLEDPFLLFFSLYNDPQKLDTQELKMR